MSAPARPTASLRRKKSWIDQQNVFVYRFGYLLMGLILRHWVRYYRAVGMENIPAEGGVFVIANHTTGMDPFVLGYPIAHRMLWGPGKVELFTNPVVGFLMKKIGMFPIKQGMADAGAVRTMVTLYRNGRTVIVYPEGARSETGELTAFVPDFARLVVKLRARLAPAAIAGGKELLPIGAYVPKRCSPVAVVFGEPFELSEFYGRKMTPELAVEAAAVMQARVAEQLALARIEREQLFPRG